MKFLLKEIQKELEFLQDYEKICQKHDMTLDLTEEGISLGYFFAIEYSKEEKKLTFNYEFGHWIGYKDFSVNIRNADLKFFLSLDENKYREIGEKLCFIRESRKEIGYAYYNAETGKYMFCDKNDYYNFEWRDCYINKEVKE